jgi:hypothetical protein
MADDMADESQPSTPEEVPEPAPALPEPLVVKVKEKRAPRAKAAPAKAAPVAPEPVAPEPAAPEPKAAPKRKPRAPPAAPPPEPAPVADAPKPKRASRKKVEIVDEDLPEPIEELVPKVEKPKAKAKAEPKPKAAAPKEEHAGPWTLEHFAQVLHSHATAAQESRQQTYNSLLAGMYV